MRKLDSRAKGGSRRWVAAARDRLLSLKESSLVAGFLTVVKRHSLHLEHMLGPRQREEVESAWTARSEIRVLVLGIAALSWFAIVFVVDFRIR